MASAHNKSCNCRSDKVGNSTLLQILIDEYKRQWENSQNYASREISLGKQNMKALWHEEPENSEDDSHNRSLFNIACDIPCDCTKQIDNSAKDCESFKYIVAREEERHASCDKLAESHKICGNGRPVTQKLDTIIPDRIIEWPQISGFNGFQYPVSSVDVVHRVRTLEQNACTAYNHHNNNAE